MTVNVSRLQMDLNSFTKDITLLFRDSRAMRISDCRVLWDGFIIPAVAPGWFRQGRLGSRCPFGVMGTAQSFGSEKKQKQNRQNTERKRDNTQGGYFLKQFVL